jgi:hypothetical protein
MTERRLRQIKQLLAESTPAAWEGKQVSGVHWLKRSLKTLLKSKKVALIAAPNPDNTINVIATVVGNDGNFDLEERANTALLIESKTMIEELVQAYERDQENLRQYIEDRVAILQQYIPDDDAPVYDEAKQCLYLILEGILRKTVCYSNMLVYIKRLEYVVASL